jgi:hypothetical protein
MCIQSSKKNIDSLIDNNNNPKKQKVVNLDTDEIIKPITNPSVDPLFNLLWIPFQYIIDEKNGKSIINQKYLILKIEMILLWRKSWGDTWKFDVFKEKLEVRRFSFPPSDDELYQFKIPLEHSIEEAIEQRFSYSFLPYNIFPSTASRIESEDLVGLRVGIQPPVVEVKRI